MAMFVNYQNIRAELRRVFSCAARSLAIALACVAVNNAMAAEGKRVLIIHSFGRDFQPLTTFSGEFRAGLARQSSQPVDFYDIELAGARFESHDEGAFLNYASALFAGHHLDLVVPMGAPAVGFAQKYRGALFPDTPMLLAAVDERMVQCPMLTTNDAVIAVRHDLLGLVEAILRLMPETTNVVLVFGNSPLERFWSNEFMRESGLPRDHVGCESFSGLTFEQMKQRAAALPRGSVMLFGDLLVDGDGIPMTGDEALDNLHAVANAPIFGIHDYQLGHGIVGGPLIAVHELARQTASAAARILKGESPASIRPPPLGEGVPTYDWRELRRWNIPESRLPAGAVVKYRGPTIWQRYRMLIVMVSSVVALQAALIVGLVLSLKRRRRAEHSLRESEERMKLAASAAELVMWDWDLQGDKLRLAGNGEKEANGKNNSDYSLFLQSIHPLDREGVAQAVAKAMNDDGSYEHVHRTASNGTVRWIAGRARVEFDPEHKPVRMRGVGMDITARKEAEEEAQRARQELAHMSRVAMLIELAGSLAHELNQPLASVVSNAEAAQLLIDRLGIDDEEVDETLKDLRDDGLQAAEIIARMRAMLKKDPGIMTRQDLNEAVREVVEMLHSELISSRVMTVLRLDPSLPFVNGQGIQLRQVLLNVIMNACDAMSGVAADKRLLTIESKCVDKDRVEMSVADTGTGFSKESLVHVFEPFHTTKTKGLGLGLAICRSIIRAHGGVLVAANGNDGGAVLRFTLPIPDKQNI